MDKFLTVFLNLLINQIFLLIFFIIFFWNIKKCLKNYKLNITKITKKDYKNYDPGKYQSLCKEEKERKRQSGRERYKNLSEDEKRKLVEYRKNIKWEKTPKYNYKKLFLFENFRFSGQA